MTLIRSLAAPLGLLILLTLFVIIGFTTAQTGLVAIALLCLWPAMWAAGAWALRGLSLNYRIVPKAGGRAVRGAGSEFT